MSGVNNDAIQACLELILQSPPGQQSHIVSDLKGMLAGAVPGTEWMERVRSILLQYTHEQLLHVTIEHEGKQDSAIVCDAAKMGDKYYHPRLSCSFSYDPIHESVSEVSSVPRSTSDTETLRAEVDQQLSKYVLNHYHTGVSCAYLPRLVPQTTSDANAETVTISAMQDKQKEKENNLELWDGANQEQPVQQMPGRVDNCDSQVTSGNDTPPAITSQPCILTLHIVGNKYNLRNFWTGRWRSTYKFDVSTQVFKHADIQVQTHYFENGNVQLQAQHSMELPEFVSTKPESLAKDVIQAIEHHEQVYQAKLFDATDTLREHAFKALRRTLPITRQKIDWSKIVSYKVGSDMAK